MSSKGHVWLTLMMLAVLYESYFTFSSLFLEPMIIKNPLQNRKDNKRDTQFTKTYFPKVPSDTYLLPCFKGEQKDWVGCAQLAQTRIKPKPAKFLLTMLTKEVPNSWKWSYYLWLCTFPIITKIFLNNLQTTGICESPVASNFDAEAFF